MRKKLLCNCPKKSIIKMKCLCSRYRQFFYEKSARFWYRPKPPVVMLTVRATKVVFMRVQYLHTYCCALQRQECQVFEFRQIDIHQAASSFCCDVKCQGSEQQYQCKTYVDPSFYCCSVKCQKLKLWEKVTIYLEIATNCCYVKCQGNCGGLYVGVVSTSCCAVKRQEC